MAKYRKKPVVIEAVQWLGTFDSYMEVERLALSEDNHRTIGIFDDNLEIPTLEGTMIASKNDWVIRGVQGEIYPCKPDIFAATYELEGTDGKA